ncbi:MAG: WecB/TagA/CpsF family glycosyltransferase [Lachnospiraceae bacterium]
MNQDLEYCTILKTNINVTDMDKTIAYITENLDKLKGDYICVSNVHTTVMAFRNEEYRKVQNSGAMALPDGQPLSIVSRQRGYVHAQRVPGPDLMPAILKLSEEKGYKHYFYGSTEKTLAELEKAMLKAYPKLQIVGAYSPPFRKLTEEEDAEIVERINQSGADFIWVALGAPKQERWMYEHQHRVNGLMIGVGAAFDFLAGTTRRAPMWMQKLCLEWVYRIMQDPKRMAPRYLNTNFAFLYYVHKENRMMKKSGKAQALSSGKEAAGKTVARTKKPLRIAMIGHKRIPSREGGVEIVVEELAVRMAAQGHRVDAYNRYGHHVSGKKYDEEYGWKGRKFYKGVRVYIVPTFRCSSLNAIVYSFFATIRALFGHYDVIHYHAEGPCAMLWLPKLFGKKLVVTIHGLDWQRAKWGNFASYVIKFGEKMAAKYADEVIVLSENVKQYFMDTYHREVTYIPNGVNRPQIRPAQMITEKYGLTKDGYFLFLARIVPEKGLHYLIEAFEKIDTDKKLVIAGGNSQAVEYMEQIHKMAAKDDRIIMTDFVQGQMLEELYSNAYAFILPSDVEGMALSLLEAMSYGNCCLVSDICENTEVTEDKALTFRKGDVADLRRQLEYMLAHPETVREYARQSTDFICGKYNWDEVTDKTITLYCRCKNVKRNEKE